LDPDPESQVNELLLQALQQYEMATADFEPPPEQSLSRFGPSSQSTKTYLHKFFRYTFKFHHFHVLQRPGEGQNGSVTALVASRSQQLPLHLVV
jgi:hypothetical protein